MFDRAFAVVWRWAMISILAALLIASGCAKKIPPAVPSAAGGPLTCSEPSYDFGRVAPSGAAALTHSFVVNNATDRPVLITAVDCSCGCTTATAVPLEVEPGHVTRIVAVAHWADHAGPQSIAILVRTPSSRGGPLILTLKGFVTSARAAVPSRVDFGSIEPGQARRRVITICGGTESAKTVQIEGASGLPVNASYALRPGEAYGVTRSANASSAEDIILTFRGLPNAQRQEGWAQVHLAGGGTVPVRFNAVSRGAIVASPSRILLVGRRSATTRLRLRLLTWGNGRVVILPPVRTKPPWFVLHIADVGPPKKLGRYRAHLFRITCAFHGGHGHCAFSSLEVESGQYRKAIPLVLMEYP